MSTTKTHDFITAVFEAFEPDKSGIIIDCVENE